jgi:hypothetical protein
MGFLSKLMKNPMVQMALPFALSAAMPGIGGMFAAGGKLGGLGLGSMFSGMNPMAANALKQSMLGYGTAALTGAKKPGKAAMYSGLASIPFSYMSAANAANAYNDRYSDLTKPSNIPMAEKLGVVGQKPAGPHAMYSQDVMGKVPVKDFKYKPMTPWEILSKNQEAIDRSNLIKAKMPDADIFTKMVTDPTTKKTVSKMDMLGTLGPVGAGLLGEYVETQDERNTEEWRKNKERRREELAWMYGVDPSMIEGEMDNPWNTGAFMNAGGIASLDMDDGGGVNGPGTGVSDSIDAKLSDGEFVMTAKAVENLGGGDRYEGARKMYQMMNMLDPESETMQEVV